MVEISRNYIHDGKKRVIDIVAYFLYGRFVTYRTVNWYIRKLVVQGDIFMFW